MDYANEYKLIRDSLNNMFYEYKMEPDRIIEATDVFLKMLDEREESDLYQYYFCHMMKSRCYLLKFNNPKALEHNKKALFYINNIKNIDYDIKVNSTLVAWWNLGLIYGDMKNIKRSIYYFDKCEKQYKKQNDKEYLAKVLNAKAYYLKNEDMILEAINMIKELKIDKMTKDEILSEMYDTKFYIYINQNKNLKAWQTLKELKFNKDLRKKLLKQYEEKFQKSNQLANAR